MSKLKQPGTINIAKRFVCAIEYGDFSGLNDREDELLTNFLEKHGGSVFVWGELETTNFARCEITKLTSDCATATIYK